MPELEVTHRVLGKNIHFIVLAGFAFLFIVDTLLSRNQKRADTDKGHFLLRTGIAALYDFLMAYTMSENLPLSPINAAAYAVSLGLPVTSLDVRFIEEFGPHRHRSRRPFLVASLLAGWGLSLLTDQHEVILDVLTAMVAGFMMYAVFGEELPKRDRIRIRWFVAGATLYFLLDLVAGS